MTEFDRVEGTISMAAGTEIQTVALWNQKLNLSNFNLEWTYTLRRTLQLSNCVGAKLKGTVTGTVRPDVFNIDLAVNDNVVGNYAQLDTVMPVDVDVFTSMYDGTNEFTCKLFKPTGWGALVWCEAFVNVHLELEYPTGEVPPPPTTPISGCFIATVAFGSKLAPELDVIRAFRDRCLPGPVTRFYYRVGAYLADFIRNRRRLKAYVRTVLWLAFIRRKR